MKINKLFSSKGFTLIELLVVISIISLLASVVMSSLNSARAKARDARRIADIQEINKLIQLYINDRGHAPYVEDGSGVCDPVINQGLTEANSCLARSAGSGSSKWVTLVDELSSYVPQLPSDPCGQVCNLFDGLYTTYAAYTYVSPNSILSSCLATGGDCSKDFSSSYKIYAQVLETRSGGYSQSAGFGSYGL